MASENTTKAQTAEFKEAAVIRNSWALLADEKTEVEDLSRLEYWRDVAYMLRQWDRIEVRHVTGKWMVELVVRSVGHLYARVAVLRKWEFDDAVAPGDISKLGYDLRFVRGKGYDVVRVADKTVIRGGFATAAEAAVWVRSEMKPAAAA